VNVSPSSKEESSCVRNSRKNNSSKELEALSLEAKERQQEQNNFSNKTKHNHKKIRQD
jgi:hypothetical protein